MLRLTIASRAFSSAAASSIVRSASRLNRAFRCSTVSSTIFLGMWSLSTAANAAGTITPHRSDFFRRDPSRHPDATPKFAAAGVALGSLCIPNANQAAMARIATAIASIMKQPRLFCPSGLIAHVSKPYERTHFIVGMSAMGGKQTLGDAGDDRLSRLLNPFPSR
jgi:hypothetical protein